MYWFNTVWFGVRTTQASSCGDDMQTHVILSLFITELFATVCVLPVTRRTLAITLLMLEPQQCTASSPPPPDAFVQSAYVNTDLT